jgi:hypothetical protein
VKEMMMHSIDGCLVIWCTDHRDVMAKMPFSSFRPGHTLYPTEDTLPAPQAVNSGLEGRLAGHLDSCCTTTYTM